MIKIVAVIAVAVVIFMFATSYFKGNVSPTVMGSAIEHIKAITTNAMNASASTVLSDNITYDELFEVVQDTNGNIQMIKANSPRINNIARNIASLAQSNLDNLGVQQVEIAMGTFTGLALLLGFGPDVAINITPIGTANCDFVSEFVSAGINQTLHKIYINVMAEVTIVTPIEEPNINIETEILVCENLIIGDVPEFYLNNGQNSPLQLSPN